jgi:hypothetical protein
MLVGVFIFKRVRYSRLVSLNVEAEVMVILVRILETPFLLTDLGSVTRVRTLLVHARLLSHPLTSQSTYTVISNGLSKREGL